MPTLAKVSLIKKNTHHHLLNVGSQNLTSTSNLIAHFFFATTSVNLDSSDSINIPCISLALGLGPINTAFPVLYLLKEYPILYT